MRTIFDTTAINSMVLKNRLVRSATWEGMCDSEGRPTTQLADCYRALALGGVGLIISGYTFVRPDGKQLPRKMGIHRDDFRDDMTMLTETVHASGGSICLQLVHAGGQTETAVAGRRPLAPSAVDVEQFPEIPEAMTRDDIDEVIVAFGDAARRAKEWGFDAIQLHGAHGYLINQFLSSLTNRRNDGYGGPIEQRCRFLLEVYRRVRSEVGDEYPVLLKLNGADNLVGGLTIDEAEYAASLLGAEGIDAIEVSGGTPASGDLSPVRAKIDGPDKEAYNLDLALRIKAAVPCPVMVVGGFRSYELVRKVIIEDQLDYVSMARPFIREPSLARRWQEGDRKPATCISCNGCFKPGLKGEGIYCVIEKKRAGEHRT